MAVDTLVWTAGSPLMSVGKEMPLDTDDGMAVDTDPIIEGSPQLMSVRTGMSLGTDDGMAVDSGGSPVAGQVECTEMSLITALILHAEFDSLVVTTNRSIFTDEFTAASILNCFAFLFSCPLANLFIIYVEIPKSLYFVERYWLNSLTSTE
jgi:hypothetical protein